MTRRWGLRRWTRVLLGVAALVACAAGCAAYLYLHYVDVLRYSAEQGRVTVERAELGRLGTVLVTNKGFALYIFAPDAARHVTCTGGCASAWPALTLHAGETVAAGAGVRVQRVKWSVVKVGRKPLLVRKSSGTRTRGNS